MHMHVRTPWNIITLHHSFAVLQLQVVHHQQQHQTCQQLANQ